MFLNDNGLIFDRNIDVENGFGGYGPHALDESGLMNIINFNLFSLDPEIANLSFSKWYNEKVIGMSGGFLD